MTGGVSTFGRGWRLAGLCGAVGSMMAGVDHLGASSCGGGGSSSGLLTAFAVDGRRMYDKTKPPSPLSALFTEHECDGNNSPVPAAADGYPSVTSTRCCSPGGSSSSGDQCSRSSPAGSSSSSGHASAAAGATHKFFDLKVGSSAALFAMREDALRRAQEELERSDVRRASGSASRTGRDDCTPVCSPPFDSSRAPPSRASSPYQYCRAVSSASTDQRCQTQQKDDAGGSRPLDVLVAGQLVPSSGANCAVVPSSEPQSSRLSLCSPSSGSAGSSHTQGSAMAPTTRRLAESFRARRPSVSRGCTEILASHVNADEENLLRGSLEELKKELDILKKDIRRGLQAQPSDAATSCDDVAGLGGRPRMVPLELAALDGGRGSGARRVPRKALDGGVSRAIARDARGNLDPEERASCAAGSDAVNGRIICSSGRQRQRRRRRR